jgi:hypothetical protein
VHVGAKILAMGDFYMTVDELLAYEPPLGIPKENILKAIDELDLIALEQLIKACSDYPDQYLYDHYVFHITKRAEELNNSASLDAVKMILAHDDKEEAHPLALWTLSKLSPIDKVVAILREALNDSYKGTYRTAAEVVVELLYHKDTEAAIMDEHPHVRLFAAEIADAQGINSTMLKALAHGDSALRQLSAWYCGRKKLQEAFDLLIQQLKLESDVEALRGMIWALGVLRKPEAKKELELLLKHPHSLIVQTTEEALSKLVASG